MPEFQCRVANPSGDVFERSYVAEDESALRRNLESQDLMILDVKRQSALLQQVARAVRFRNAVSSREFLIFNQELSALVRAGLPIVPSLELLLERRKNATFKQALQDVRDRVKSGESLSEAFAAQGDLFPSLYSASLASGERSGELASVLQRFIAYMTNLLAIQRRVVSALIYPAILLCLAFCLVAVLIFFIIPKFSVFLDEFGADLPLITEVLVAVATFCTERWQIVLGSLVAAVVAFLFWRKTPQGRFTLDRVKLKLPLAGRVMQDYAQNRFTRTLGTLQAGGIPLVTSIELAARATGNAVFERELLKVVGKVREGEALWESLDRTGLLSDIAVQMIKVGESTGALEEMLHQSSDFTDAEIDTRLTRLVSLVEPLMLVFMAFVVAGMLMSIYLPLIQAYGQTDRGL
jgi:type IV pilus assembly protein PilC